MVGKKTTKSIGDLGEHIALKALEKQGYVMIERNFFVRGGEIDLIMEKDGSLCFVEVKTRHDNRFGEALDSITPQKKKRILHTAEVYLQHSGGGDRELRFMAVGIVLDEKNRVKSLDIVENMLL